MRMYFFFLNQSELKYSFSRFRWLIFLAILAGCNAPKLTSYKSVDVTARSVTIIAGFNKNPLLTEIFVKNGWGTEVDASPESRMLFWTLWNNPRINQSSSRYQILEDSYMRDNWFGPVQISHELSMFDNSKGEKVFELSCVCDYSKFLETLNSIIKQRSEE